MTFSTITKCSACGRTELTWHTGIVNRSGVQQGRLNTHDVDCSFFLGCDFCSETLAVASADDIAQHLTERMNELRDDDSPPAPEVEPSAPDAA